MRKLIVIVGLALVAGACSGDDQASPTPAPNQTASVRGATFGSPSIADITAVRACTLLGIGEIQAATGTIADQPVAVGDGTEAPGCSWRIGGREGALIITVQTADAYRSRTPSIAEDGVGQAAEWVSGEEGGGELHVLVADRDRTLRITVTPGVVADARRAARTLALTAIPRL